MKEPGEQVNHFGLKCTERFMCSVIKEREFKIVLPLGCCRKGSITVPVQASVHVPVSILVLALFTLVCYFPVFAKVSSI